jgi:hypothetical protein
MANRESEILQDRPGQYHGHVIIIAPPSLQRPDPGGMASAAATLAVAGAALRLANPCGIFRARPNPWHNKTVGPLPQTGVIGFKLTGSPTRHTSTQDRPASEVSLVYYDRQSLRGSFRRRNAGH